MIVAPQLSQNFVNLMFMKAISGMAGIAMSMIPRAAGCLASRIANAPEKSTKRAQVRMTYRRHHFRLETASSPRRSRTKPTIPRAIQVAMKMMQIAPLSGIVMASCFIRWDFHRLIR
jgi:hypothetical protein